MTTVSVASGKGGAGKTSIAAAVAMAIAAESGEKCVFADCDVDAANGAIALNAWESERSPYFAGPGFSITAKACDACGRCILACRFDAIRKSADGQSCAIVPELCERCGACLDSCPGGSVAMHEKQAGEFLVSSTARGPTLVHAELEPGEDTSGKLVAKVRKRAELEAKTESFIVVDAPPGIGCPVIASITGVDLLVIVVESSASGIRDAARLIELARSMKRRSVGVVNKAGLDAGMDERALALLADAGIPLAGRIPFDPALRSAEESNRTWASVDCESTPDIQSALAAVKGILDTIKEKR